MSSRASCKSSPRITRFKSSTPAIEDQRPHPTLLDAHPQALNGNLRALIAFGEIVSTGASSDINLLEVVTGWQGTSHVSYGSTAELPLRGRLNLYFLRPEEFEHPTETTLEVLSRVRPAYAILLEEPNDYARQVMARIEGLPSLGAANIETADPNP